MISPERWQQIEELFHSALEREPEQRLSFLARACNSDSTLLAEVAALLAAHDESGGPVDAPAVEAVTGLVSGPREPTPPPPRVGQLLGHYQILAPLGKGGMGVVYLAADSRLDRKIALKILPPEFSASPDRLRRFAREARAISALNHPNIITIFEIGQASGAHFMATEFVAGLTLRQWMKAARAGPAEVIGIAMQIAGALAAAHEAGIAHRDIKPENIMVRPDGLVKVLDFGLAKRTERTDAAPDSEAATEASATTVPGLIMGTLAYMSPEQARGLKIDGRSDIFSLGVVLYEMIAGRVPFAGPTPSDVIAAILTATPLPLAQAAPELQAIVSRALEKDPESRYQSATEILRDLRLLDRRLGQETGVGVLPSGESGSAGSTRIIGAPPAHRTADQPATATGETAAGQVTRSARYGPRGAGRRRLWVAGAAAVLTALAGLAAYRLVPSRGAIDSIAVMPLVHVGDDPSMEYLSDGLTESLINSLSQLPDLKVMSRNSVFRFKGQDVDAEAVGKRLRVRAVLTGRVIQRGDDLLVRLELADVEDGRQLWGEQYQRRISDLLAVQAQISREISEKLRTRLSGEEEQRAARQLTEDPEAYQFYLLGRFNWNKGSEEGLRKAIEYFDRAVAKDPNYALAYAGLADAYNTLAANYQVPGELIPRAREYALKALELDDGLADVHYTRGANQFLFDWDWAGAEKSLKRAIVLNPSHTSARNVYSQLLWTTGRVREAVAECRRAFELDPISVRTNFNLGLAYYVAREYDRAIEQNQKTLEIDQNFFLAFVKIAQAYERQGQTDEAFAVTQKALARFGQNPLLVTVLGQVYASQGKREEALRIVGELEQIAHQKYVRAYEVALIHAGLGDTDRAMLWLEKAYAEHSPWILMIKAEPKLDALRDDPRYKALLRRINLPQ